MGSDIALPGSFTTSCKLRSFASSSVLRLSRLAPKPRHRTRPSDWPTFASKELVCCDYDVMSRLPRFLKPLLRIVPAVECFGSAPDLRRVTNRCPSGCVLSDGRLLGIVIFDGAAWVYFLEHHRRGGREILGRHARDCHVGNTDRRNCMCCFSNSALRFSRWMAWFG